MPGVRTPDSNVSSPPEAQGVLGELFDEVWASVAPDYGDCPDQIETARLRLTTIVLELANDGELSPLQITATAARLIREKSPPRPSLPRTKSASIEG